MKIPFVISLPAIVSAWHLQLYKNELYNTVIEDRSGHLGQPCKTLASQNKNVVSSMHWQADGTFGTCTIKLYDADSCTGALLGSSKGDWNLPNFSSSANDKTNSYKIDC